MKFFPVNHLPSKARVSSSPHSRLFLCSALFLFSLFLPLLSFSASTLCPALAQPPRAGLSSHNPPTLSQSLSRTQSAPIADLHDGRDPLQPILVADLLVLSLSSPPIYLISAFPFLFGSVFFFFFFLFFFFPC